MEWDAVFDKAQRTVAQTKDQIPIEADPVQQQSIQSIAFTANWYKEALSKEVSDHWQTKHRYEEAVEELRHESRHQEELDSAVSKAQEEGEEAAQRLADLQGEIHQNLKEGHDQEAWLIKMKVSKIEEWCHQQNIGLELEYANRISELETGYKKAILSMQAQHQEEISELKEELNNRQFQHTRVANKQKTEERESRRQSEDFRKQLKWSSELNESLQVQLKKRASECEELEATGKTLRDENSKLQREYSKLYRNREDLRSKFETLESCSEMLNKEMCKPLPAKRSNIDALLGQLDDLKHDHQQLRVEHQRLQAELQEFVEQFEESVKINDGLQTELEEANRQVKVCHVRICKLCQSYKVRSDMCSDRAFEITVLEFRCRELQEAKESLEQEVCGLRRTCKELGIELVEAQGFEFISSPEAEVEDSESANEDEDEEMGEWVPVYKEI